MKFALLLCTLILSLQGWCASGAAPQHATRAITSVNSAIENRQVEIETGKSLMDKMTTTMIVLGLMAYLTAVIGCAIKAKLSLDRTLKDVLQDMVQYS